MRQTRSSRRRDQINDLLRLQDWSRTDALEAQAKLYRFMIGEPTTRATVLQAQTNSANISDRMRKKLFELIDTVRPNR